MTNGKILGEQIKTLHISPSDKDGNPEALCPFIAPMETRSQEIAGMTMKRQYAPCFKWACALWDKEAFCCGLISK